MDGRENIGMEDKKLFWISDVAKMFHVSAGTLRHYEQAGLLAPEYTDPDTGYRYYGIRQFEVLNTIRYLRVLDLPLSQIAEFLQNRDTDVIEEKLEKQKALIQQKKRELEIMERKIDHRIEQIRDARCSRLEEIQLKIFPETRMVLLRDPVRPRSYLDLEIAIRQMQKGQSEAQVFLGKVGVGISKEHLREGSFEVYDWVFLILDEEDHYDGQTELLPSMECATIRFRGGHKEAPRYYQMLLNFLTEKHLMPAGFSQEITLIDDGMTSDSEKFVTEIRLPVCTAMNR